MGPRAFAKTIGRVPYTKEPSPRLYGFRLEREESKYSPTVLGKAIFSSTIDMKRSSGWRCWPPSQSRPWNRKIPPRTRIPSRMARARARERCVRRASACSAHRDAQALAGEKTGDLVAVGLDPREQ